MGVFVLCSSAHAELGTGWSLGSPVLSGGRLVWHPGGGDWGGQIEVGSNQVTTSESGGRLRTVRIDTRFALSEGFSRAYLFGGWTHLSGKISDFTTASEALGLVDFGVGGEIRFVPGIGIGIEVGPMIPLTSVKGFGSVGLVANFAILGWIDWF